MIRGLLFIGLVIIAERLLYNKSSSFRNLHLSADGFEGWMIRCSMVGCGLGCIWTLLIIILALLYTTWSFTQIVLTAAKDFLRAFPIIIPLFWLLARQAILLLI